MDNIKQVELAKKTLKVFQDQGEDMSDVRHVVHYFYGGNFGGLGAALRELGYEVRNTVNDDGVVAERHEAVGEEWRTTTLSSLCELADTYDVEYDGWEAAMVRQQSVPAMAVHTEKQGNWFAKLFGKKN